MIRGIYRKIFVWFCFTMFTTCSAVFIVTVFIQGHAFSPRWMTGVMDQNARSAVESYEFSGSPGLRRYFEEMSASSRVEVALVDQFGHELSGRGIPDGVGDVLATAQDSGQSSFKTGMRWRGASVVERPEGRFIFVAAFRPFESNWSNGVIPLLRLAVALLSGGLLCLLLAGHFAKPIQVLQVVAGRIADGDLSVRASPVLGLRNDELSDLAEDFDRMADRVQTLLERQQALLADVSHELRSPLARMSLSLELLRRGDTEAVERMQVDMNRLDTSIGQILALARLEHRGTQQSLSVLNLRDVVESIAEDSRFEGSEHSKAIVLSRMDDCWLKGDPTLVRSCIENVVRNAVQYTKPFTEVSISLEFFGRDQKEFAKILVRDQGEGVPTEVLARLFDPFFRVARPGEQNRGTGLGLSIAQRIVTSHGGSIVARNQPSGGLEIEVRFPAFRTDAYKR